MYLYEYQGKELFWEAGIPTPRGIVVKNPEEAEAAFAGFSSGVAVKAQVHTGGRGKSGGIRLARTIEELRESIGIILGMDIKGHTVRQLLVEEILPIKREFYLGLIVNGKKGMITFMFSPFGGVDIEEAAGRDGSGFFQWDIEDPLSVEEFHIRNFLRKGGLQGNILASATSIAFKLYNLFLKKDLVLAEINPLVLTEDGNLKAADARIETDDNALFRQPDLSFTVDETTDKLELRAREIGVSYVQLPGDVGIIASGAGLAMNTMDILERRGRKPSNFLETGGGITSKLIADSIELLISNPAVKGVLVNLYGGVNPMVEAAMGVISGLKNCDMAIPVVVKLLGNQQEEAWSILESADIPVVKSVSTEKAVDILLEKMGAV